MKRFMLMNLNLKKMAQLPLSGGTLLNILWLFSLAGDLCLMHIFCGIAQCVTIIGIPVGIANFKIAAIAVASGSSRSFLLRPPAPRVKPMPVAAFSNWMEQKCLALCYAAILEQRLVI